MNVSHRQRKRVFISILGLLVLWTWPNAGDALPQDPNNAALLYYQACLKRSLLDAPGELGFVLHGRDPSEKFKGFVNQADFQEVIALTNVATEMSRCEWGLRGAFQWRAERSVNTALDSLGNLLAAHARVLAADGQHVSALKAALSMRRFGKHIGDDVYGMWVMSESVDGKAFSVIQYILAKMAPDIEILRWLEDELTRVGQAPQWDPRETLADWRDMEARGWLASPDMFAEWKESLIQRQTDEALRKEMRNLTDAQMLERARTAYDGVIESAVAIIEGDTSYLDKRDQIEQLVADVRQRIQKGDPIAYMVRAIDLSLEPYYRFHVNHVARVNAVKAALDVYLIKAQTGQLPPSLPNGLPSDPYSGEDFEYEITPEGFSLRCRVSVPEYSGGPRKFDFKIRP